MIPATQRTNNEAGYAMDVTPWSTESQLWIKMEAYTPVLPINSVFEMYVSILDTWDTTRTMYDSVKCSTEYKGDSTENNTNEYTVDDYVSSILFSEDPSTSGTYISSVAPYLDTVNGGSLNWYVSPYVEENSVDCNEFYCKLQCVVYRKQITTDRVNDVQYSERGTLKSYGGYRMWPTKTSKLTSAKQGISKQVEVSYGAATSNFVISLAAVTGLISLSLF